MRLITGHKGAIGSKLAAKLGNEFFYGIDTKGGEDLLTCELPNEIDTIFHLAAHPSVEDSWLDPLRTMENFTTTVRLATRYPDAKIIFASTGCSINPVSPYAFSKFCSNEYLKTFHKNAVILYFPNIWGTGRSVVDLFKGKKEVTIYGDGYQVRDYVHIDDIVEALVLAKDWEPGEYFLGSGLGTNLLELARDKKINFMPERKEERESILQNTTPNWRAKIKVKDYEIL